MDALLFRLRCDLTEFHTDGAAASRTAPRGGPSRNEFVFGGGGGETPPELGRPTRHPAVTRRGRNGGGGGSSPPAPRRPMCRRLLFYVWASSSGALAPIRYRGRPQAQSYGNGVFPGRTAINFARVFRFGLLGT